MAILSWGVLRVSSSPPTLSSGGLAYAPRSRSRFRDTTLSTTRVCLREFERHAGVMSGTSTTDPSRPKRRDRTADQPARTSSAASVSSRLLARWRMGGRVRALHLLPGSCAGVRTAMFAADYRCFWLTGVTARRWAAGPCRRGGIVPRARTASVSAGRDWARALSLCVLPGRPARARRVSGGLPDHRRSLCSAVFLGSLSGVAELWVGVNPAAGV